MKKLGELKKFLDQFPEDSLVYAYQGTPFIAEPDCVVVRDAANENQLGYFECSEQEGR